MECICNKFDTVWCVQNMYSTLTIWHGNNRLCALGVFHNLLEKQNLDDSHNHMDMHPLQCNSFIHINFIINFFNDIKTSKIILFINPKNEDFDHQ